MQQELKSDLESGASPDFARIVVSGPITLNNLFGLQTALRAQQPATLVLDLHGVPYVDSAGLGAIVNAHVSAQRRGGRLLLSGVNDRVKTLFQVTKVDSVLNFSETESQVR